ncbi:hypothetical protein [Actinoplanes couchii]|uniref:hypothetical protein n=1 Tax=Actinoplanes couchii TaxID=403638 RepID=UPI0019438E42|nr:hypothetical protein [Actinoplanes couchii]MDR6324654.1 hypothetical protein [Actinoplanes couchii]
MFIGRDAELRALHTALTESRVCVPAGPPGAGKTAFATAYVTRSGAGYRGIWRVSLAGSSADPDEMVATFAAGLRAQMALGPAGDPIAEFAERVVAETGPSLLIVDDIPGGLDDDLIGRLTVPAAGRRLRTVLLTNRDVSGLAVPTVDIGPLGLEESAEILRGHRDGTVDEAVELAERLGGHAFAVRLAGLALRDRAGYAKLIERIDGNPVAMLLRDRLDALSEPACRLLRVASLTSPAALPPGLIRLFMGAAAEEAADELARNLFATRIDGTWHVHSLARDVARRYLPAIDWTRLARQFADAVLDHPWSDPIESFLVARHAARLAGRPDLPGAIVDRLHRRVVAHGSMTLPHHRELAEQNFDDPVVLIEAARHLRDAGELGEARDCADRAVPLATDPALRHRARLLLAETIEELGGDTTRADALWTILTSEGDTGTAIARLRARRLRGEHEQARTGLTELIERLGPGSAAFLPVQEAQRELARAEIDAGLEAAARRRLVRVIADHLSWHQDDHPGVVEAIRMLAAADLALPLTEPKNDRAVWEETARELRRLRGRFATGHGPRHLATLTLAVVHAEALVAWGRPDEAVQELAAVREDVRDRFTRDQPIRFRAELLFGWATGGDEHFEDAYRGARAVLGETHPQTLRAELSLGVALKPVNRSRAARHILRVLRHSPGAFLPGQHWPKTRRR